MAIKHILLPLTGEAHSADAAICGLALAKQLGAHVTAGYEDELGPLYVGPDFGAVANLGSFFERMQEIRADRKARARAHFDNAVGKIKLPIVSAPVCKQGSTMWIEHKGGDEAPISAFGPLTDLIVLNAPGNTNSPTPWNVVEEALFGAHRPTMIVPHGTRTIDLSHALIAWNGSSEAVSAVERALDLLSPGAKVTVLQIGELKPGRVPAEKLLDYLGWHCFDAELRHLPERPNETCQIILDEVRRAKAGVLIMGAYTHSRTREMILGGVTDFMLRNTPLPILMAH